MLHPPLLAEICDPRRIFEAASPSERDLSDHLERIGKNVPLGPLLREMRRGLRRARAPQSLMDSLSTFLVFHALCDDLLAAQGVSFVPSRHASNSSIDTGIRLPEPELIDIDDIIPIWDRTTVDRGRSVSGSGFTRSLRLVRASAGRFGDGKSSRQLGRLLPDRLGRPRPQPSLRQAVCRPTRPLCREQ